MSGSILRIPPVLGSYQTMYGNVWFYGPEQDRASKTLIEALKLLSSSPTTQKAV